jgi:hypothetical protein
MMAQRRTSSKAEEFRFTSTLERSTNKLWGAHVRVPKRIVDKLVEDDSRRVVCTLNGEKQYQCALLPFGDGIFVVSVNKTLRKSLGLEFGKEVEVMLRKDRSEYGLPMPEEFREALRQDAGGDKLFHALTRGRQRTLLYIVGSAKLSDKRIAYAITIITHLKENGGKINYRQLNLALRNSRRVPRS